MTMELAALPPPQVLEDLDFEVVYQEKLEAFRMSMGDNWSAALESDPVLKLIEQAAYGAVQNRARVNDAGKALLLAHAMRGDLDHLAANVNLQRLVIQVGDPSTVPPTPQVLEDDDALRERIQLSYEGLTTAGPRNSYILHARNASGLWVIGSRCKVPWSSITPLKRCCTRRARVRKTKPTWLKPRSA